MGKKKVVPSATNPLQETLANLNRLDTQEPHLGFLGKKVAPSDTNPLHKTWTNLNRLDPPEPHLGYMGKKKVAPSTTNPLQETWANLNRLDPPEHHLGYLGKKKVAPSATNPLQETMRKRPSQPSHSLIACTEGLECPHYDALEAEHLHIWIMIIFSFAMSWSS